MQRRQIGLRLDHDAGPSTLVEPKRDAPGNRMSAADVDVSAMARPAKRNIEVIVLHVLGVGERSPEGLVALHHGPVIMGFAVVSTVRAPYFSTDCRAVGGVGLRDGSACLEDLMNVLARHVPLRPLPWDPTTAT